MPKNIKTKHLKRMFPFEFYDELNEAMTEYKMYNPAFLLSETLNLDQDMRRKLYESIGKDMAKRARETIKKLHSDNIIEVEPFGEMLMLDLCIEAKYIDDIVNKRLNQTELSQQSLNVLAVQYYDSSNLPVFSKDVTEESIEQIPEVLWDDPNLGIYIIVFGEEGAKVGIIRMPERIQEIIFEPTEAESKGDSK